MKTNAQTFTEKFLGRNIAACMTSLDDLDIEKEQDWENGTTTWVFDDGSKIRVGENDIELLSKDIK